jgi:hypothetical protein
MKLNCRLNPNVRLKVEPWEIHEEEGGREYLKMKEARRGLLRRITGTHPGSLQHRHDHQSGKNTPLIGLKLLALTPRP